MSEHPFLKARMREQLDRIQTAAAKVIDSDDIAVAISFGEGDERRRFSWPIEREAAKKLYAELGVALKKTR